VVLLLLLLFGCREQFFEQEIATIRKRELELQFKNAAIKTINLAMVFGTPPMTACVIFAAYEMVIGKLSATLAFTTLSLFNILRFPLVVLPKAMRALSEALASIERVEGFLLEHVPTDAEGIQKSNSVGVSIVSALLERGAEGQCYWGWRWAHKLPLVVQHERLAGHCDDIKQHCPRSWLAFVPAPGWHKSFFLSQLAAVVPGPAVAVVGAPVPQPASH
jgi:hypothetical protein